MLLGIKPTVDFVFKKVFGSPESVCGRANLDSTPFCVAGACNTPKIKHFRPRRWSGTTKQAPEAVGAFTGAELVQNHGLHRDKLRGGLTCLYADSYGSSNR